MAAIFPLPRADLAIDFGTANLRVIRRDSGVVFDQPSLCCFARTPTSRDVFAIGLEAKATVDRTPPHLDVKRPLIRGVLQDIETARALLDHAMKRALGTRRLRSPAVMMGVPADATLAERDALIAVARDVGLRRVRLVPEPLAAAAGAELPYDRPGGTMIVECGAGTTEVAVLSLSGLCLSRSVRTGGAALDQAIADHLHAQHKFLVGEQTAERIKLEHVARRDDAAAGGATVLAKGLSLTSRRPATIEVALAELDEVVDRHATLFVTAVLDALNATPPELSQDIHDRGIVLTAGAATSWIRRRVSEASGVRVSIAEAPLHCVARGLQHLLSAAA